MGVNLYSMLYAGLMLFCVVLTKPAACASTDVDVLILGAGISGITAGNYLHNNGMANFLILEAQDYIGGRVKQFYIGNVTVGEGVNWVHYIEEGDENPILGFANKINLAKYLTDYRDFTVRNSLGQSKADLEKALKSFKDVEAKVIKKNEANQEKGDHPLSSVLALNGWMPNTPLKRIIEWQYLDFEFAAKAELLSTRHFTGTPEENEIVTDSRGFKGIIDHLAANITDKIKKQKAVTQIKYNLSGIEVRTKDGETYKAKYGICTFSTGVLASDLVKFIPELPTWKKTAISRIPLAYYTNIFVKFASAFWEENEFIFNAGSKGEVFVFLYNLNKKGIHKGSNMLLFTAVEDNALRIEAQTKNETKDEVMRTLRKMYPNVTIPQPTEIYVSQFSQNPYIRGSFSNAVVGATSADFNNLQGRLGHLLFAGEATDEDYWGDTQSAYLTGLKQAKATLSCLNGKQCPEYKPQDAGVCKTDDEDSSSASVRDNEIPSFICFLFLVMYALFTLI